MYEDLLERGGTTTFTFIDLFAGIGGFRLGLESCGGRAVCSVEKDKFARQTYQAWFNDTPLEDICKIDPKDLPDHQILTAGFPCQPFSVAKRNYTPNDDRVNLFQEIIRIATHHHTPILILENVKGLLSHNKGQTFQNITEALNQVGYRVWYQVINSKHWVPQSRERIIFVCLHRDHYPDQEFQLMDLPEHNCRVTDVLEPDPDPTHTLYGKWDYIRDRARRGWGYNLVQDKQYANTITACYGSSPGRNLINQTVQDILEPNPDPRFTLTDHQWNYQQERKKKNKAAGKGFGYKLLDLNDVSNTITASYHKDGADALVPLEGRNPRRLTPREVARLMGFPDSLPIVVSNTQAYKQFGNAVVPQLIRHIGMSLIGSGLLASP